MSREKGIHEIETHVACVCIKQAIRESLKILIAKRSPYRSLFPNYWECGGGQVHTGEDFEAAVVRQIKDEFGVDIEIECVAGVYKIETAEGIIPGVRFVGRLMNEEQKITLNLEEFVESKWIGEDELDMYEFIPTLREDVRKALELYKRLIKG